MWPHEQIGGVDGDVGARATSDKMIHNNNNNSKWCPFHAPALARASSAPRYLIVSLFIFILANQPIISSEAIQDQQQVEVSPSQQHKPQHSASNQKHAQFTKPTTNIIKSAAKSNKKFVYQASRASNQASQPSIPIWHRDAQTDGAQLTSPESLEGKSKSLLLHKFAYDTLVTTSGAANKSQQRENHRRLSSQPTDLVESAASNGSQVVVTPLPPPPPPSPTRASAAIQFDDEDADREPDKKSGANEAPDEGDADDGESTLTTDNLLLILDKSHLNNKTAPGTSDKQPTDKDPAYESVTAKYRPQVYTTLNSRFFEVSLPFGAEGAAGTSPLPPELTERSAAADAPDKSRRQESAFYQDGPTHYADPTMLLEGASLLEDETDGSRPLNGADSRVRSELSAGNNGKQLLNKRRLSDNRLDYGLGTLMTSAEIFEAPLNIRFHESTGTNKREEVLDWKPTRLLVRKKPSAEPAGSKLRIAASASSTGIRVTADNSKQLIINSRGLITAAKKGQKGGSNFAAYNASKFSLQPNQLADHLLNPLKPSVPERLTIVVGNGSRTGELPTFLKRPNLSVSGNLWKQQPVPVHSVGLQQQQRNRTQQEILSYPVNIQLESANEIDNNAFNRNSSAFQHNPPYKQPVPDSLTTPSQVVVTEPQSAATMMLTSTSLPPATTTSGGKRTNLPTTKRPGPSRTSVTRPVESSLFSTGAPPYEHTTISSDLITTNQPISQQLNVFKQNVSSTASPGSTGRPQSNKIRYKLHHIIMGKLGKNSQTSTNGSANYQSQTPAPLLSTTVANNVATLLAQKLNLMNLVKPLTSSFNPPTGSYHHQQPLSSGFNSLFGVRVGAPSQHVGGKLLQRVSALTGAGQAGSPSAINRRTSGMGSLLLSGFVYGLSVLPALMALTGINPLSEGSAAAGQSLAANRHSGASATDRMRAPPKKRRKPNQAGSSLSSASAANYAFLVPLISAAASEVVEEEQQAASESLLGLNDRPVSGSNLKSLYAPPPTIIEPNSIESDIHPLVEELSNGYESFESLRRPGALSGSQVGESVWTPGVSLDKPARPMRNHRDTSLWQPREPLKSFSFSGTRGRPFDDRASIEYETDNKPYRLENERQNENKNTNNNNNNINNNNNNNNDNDNLEQLLASSPATNNRHIGFSEQSPATVLLTSDRPIPTTQAPLPGSSKLLLVDAASSNAPTLQPKPFYYQQRQQSSGPIFAKPAKLITSKAQSQRNAADNFVLAGGGGGGGASVTMEPLRLRQAVAGGAPSGLIKPTRRRQTIHTQPGDTGALEPFSVPIGTVLGFNSNPEDPFPPMRQAQSEQQSSRRRRAPLAANFSSPSPASSGGDWRAISPVRQSSDSTGLLDQILERTRRKMANQNKSQTSRRNVGGAPATDRKRPSEEPRDEDLGASELLLAHSMALGSRVLNEPARHNT